MQADKSYHGLFDLDKKHGQAHVHYKDGRKFTGTFLTGKQDGPGCLITSPNHKKYGLWTKGKHVKYYDSHQAMV